MLFRLISSEALCIFLFHLWGDASGGSDDDQVVSWDLRDKHSCILNVSVDSYEA
jgi:hypothetical protein